MIAKILKLGCKRADPDAANPMERRLTPTNVKPNVHVNTGPIDLKILLDNVLDTTKLILASDVNSRPISFVDIPWFLRKVEKKLRGQ